MSKNSSPVTSDIDFEKDGKQVSYLRIPHSQNRSAWGAVMLPIAVIKNGAGPTLYFNAGSHGGEYEGPITLLKLIRKLNTKDIQGRVIIIPALNLPAVQAGNRLSPIDHKDMNRVFPGKPNGTITEVIAHYVYHFILPLSDAVIDLHSGGYSLNLSPFISMHYLEDKIIREETLAALKAFQAPTALIIKEISGGGLLDYEVERMGKIFLFTELSGGGSLSPKALKIAETGVDNLLVHFGVKEGKIMTREEQGLSETEYIEVPDPNYYHIAMQEGIFEPFWEIGDQVENGQMLGQIHQVETPEEQPEPILAQRSGKVIGLRVPGQVKAGDSVVLLGQIIERHSMKS